MPAKSPNNFRSLPAVKHRRTYGEEPTTPMSVHERCKDDGPET